MVEAGGEGLSVYDEHCTVKAPTCRMYMRHLSSIVGICDCDDGARQRISIWRAIAVGATELSVGGWRHHHADT